jgi:quercetin dioxygenase-like cupin family protein
MFCYHEKIKKKDLGKGVTVQELGQGERMNVLHWNMADKSVVPMHQHSQEQFGYVIKGGFEMVVGDEKTVLKAGDAYFIPADVMHSFTAVGDTEAIDVFNPVKEDFPWLE